MTIKSSKMSSTASTVGRDVEAREYLEQHRVLELFNNMTSQLIYNRPENPKKYMIDLLEKLQRSRATKHDYPCLFDDTNIQSVYNMLDPTNRGFITLQQYKEAMDTLGISPVNEKVEGASEDKINFDTFLSQARSGLSKASATFQAS
ncbi:EF-hand calcium-binding domain-containing protein 10 [Magallana gigas]|uniref:EF-hand calcium-binding domain-containing protein 10 n=1 Tax=Magallana gigas TaxID=29159 RepID=UPI000975264E|nr:EF-hand calcium-binding domain-containing protein 10 [Crassostrea gigas]|eukprot:XP_011440511.2 PREDICTED: EF-hand calcium-binding domain-containing protein 10 [Crassostrea gigas]